MISYVFCWRKGSNLPFQVPADLRCPSSYKQSRA